MTQTAVDFLLEKQNSQMGMLLNSDFIQAKEIEKQQQGYSEEDLKEAYTEGSFAQLRYIDGLPYIDRDRWF